MADLFAKGILPRLGGALGSPVALIGNSMGAHMAAGAIRAITGVKTYITVAGAGMVQAFTEPGAPQIPQDGLPILQHR